MFPQGSAVELLFGVSAGVESVLLGVCEFLGVSTAFGV